jgi:hypothetical protein
MTVNRGEPGRSIPAYGFINNTDGQRTINTY